jgi:5'-deoxynucleotidase YfbR-like HD superfamily hydrolase
VKTEGLLRWGALHRVHREGWTDRGADVLEWVFDHPSYVGFAAVDLGSYVVTPGFKIQRLQSLARLHDHGEIKGDKTPHFGLNPRHARQRRKFFRMPPLEPTESERQRKLEEEEASLRELAAYLHPRVQGYVLNCWAEYAENETPEARFVHQVHALVDCCRATLYKWMFPKEEFSTFFDTAQARISDPVLLTLVECVKRRYDGPPLINIEESQTEALT